jgi:hypothetical protein
MYKIVMSSIAMSARSISLEEPNNPCKTKPETMIKLVIDMVINTGEKRGIWPAARRLLLSGKERKGPDGDEFRRQKAFTRRWMTRGPTVRALKIDKTIMSTYIVPWSRFSLREE